MLLFLHLADFFNRAAQFSCYLLRTINIIDRDKNVRAGDI